MNLEEIRARAEAATQGPWHRVGTSIDANVPLSDDGPPTTRWNTTVVCSVGAWGSGRPIEADAEFIAHARTDVPALLDRLDQIRQLCQSYTPEPPPLFRGPGLSEHGEGYNHGTRDMAEAVLDVLNSEEES